MWNPKNYELVDFLMNKGFSGVGKTQNELIPVDKILFEPSLLIEKGCLLLYEFNADSWRINSRHPEYAVFRKKMLDKVLDLSTFSNVCLNYKKKCKHFQEYNWNINTGLDPIRVEKYGEYYIAHEGKHRICFAHRSGIKEIVAEVTEIYI